MKHFLEWVGGLLGLWIAFNVCWFASTTEWRKRGLYLHRTRKPHAFLGLPVIGRHTAYFGQTGSRRIRDRAHKFGYEGSSPSVWTDLSLRIYPWPCWFPGWKWAREVQEKLWIIVLLPVYNVQWNTVNPRRIPRRYAELMRERRQRGGRRFNLTYAMLRAPLNPLVWLAVYVGHHWIA